MNAKLKGIAIVAVLAALITVIVRQERRARSLIADAAALREQSGQTAALREENARLTEQLRQVSERTRVQASELARLRGQAVRVQQVEQENARLISDRERLANAVKSSAPQTKEDAAPETDEKKLQRAKGLFGRDLGLAIIRAAEANGGAVPVELSGPLFETVETLSRGGEYDLRAKHFEMVYSGSLNEVKEPSDTVLAREKQPVQLSDGKWRRLYVMADGSSRFLAAEEPDGFNEREKELWPWRGMR